MNPEILIPLLFVTFVTTTILVGSYNKFIKYRNRIEEALNNIDVALKRRANLIPGLVKIIKGYSAHEDNIYQSKTRQLSKISNPDRVEEEREITHNIGGLLAVAEAYPDLKASANFLDLQNSLDEIEEEIQKTRNRYNNYISRFNTMVESFPSSLIAMKFAFKRQEYLNLELATERGMPDVSFDAKD